MTSSLTPAETDRLAELTDLVAVVIAATRLHDSLYYGPAATVHGLPPGVVKAFEDLGVALERAAYPVRVFAPDQPAQPAS